MSPPHRPCCSKSDDFSTFGSIFLEKGFEREVRTSEQPQEGGLQGLRVGDRDSQHPRKVCSRKVLGNHPAATREGSGVHPACWGLCWSHHSACHAREWFAYWGLGGFAPKRCGKVLARPHTVADSVDLFRKKPQTYYGLVGPNWSLHLAAVIPCCVLLVTFLFFLNLAVPFLVVE